MIKIDLETQEVMGFKGALRGMRNPFDSWAKSDSSITEQGVFIGDNDMGLAKRLTKAGTDHRKFMRMVHVQVDVTAPFYWWKEYDTYKVGTVANSCSTMHTITKKPIELTDFSMDDSALRMEGLFPKVVDGCEQLRKKFLETKDKSYWRALIQALPMSYNQKRTLDLSYEVLLRIYFSRRGHRLSEWHTFCEWINSLPYMGYLISALEAEEETK